MSEELMKYVSTNFYLDILSNNPYKTIINHFANDTNDYNDYNDSNNNNVINFDSLANNFSKKCINYNESKIILDNINFTISNVNFTILDNKYYNQFIENIFNEKNNYFYRKIDVYCDLILIAKIKKKIRYNKTKKSFQQIRKKSYYKLKFDLKSKKKIL